MCFSPKASFGAAAALSVLGIAGLRKTGRSKYALLAVIPCIFAVQQALEGFVWLAAERGDFSSSACLLPAYAYLFFAGVWWPLYIPAVLWYLEASLERKKWLLVPLAAGVLVSCIVLLNFYLSPVAVQIVDHHIAYQQLNTFPFHNELYLICLAL